MPDHVYKIIEMTGTSAMSSDDAIRNAIARAGKTMHNLRWFEVVELRGGIDGGHVNSWQATIKIGFTLDD
jgi:dodecin